MSDPERKKEEVVQGPRDSINRVGRPYNEMMAHEAWVGVAKGP